MVSSQYNLLTTCAEAITSLIYPLTWTHAYIPILPRQLLGNVKTHNDDSFEMNLYEVTSLRIVHMIIFI